MERRAPSDISCIDVKAQLMKEANRLEEPQNHAPGSQLHDLYGALGFVEGKRGFNAYRPFEVADYFGEDANPAEWRTFHTLSRAAAGRGAAAAAAAIGGGSEPAAHVAEETAGGPGGQQEQDSSESIRFVQ